MRSRVLLVAVAVATTVAVAGCTSSNSGTPEPDTVSLPSDVTSSSGPVTTVTPVTPTSTPVSPTSTAPSVTIKPAPSTPIREANVTSVDGKTSYHIKIWAQTTSSTCANHAYGTQVVEYLTAHPCAGLTRILATTTVGGRPVGFAQSSLGFLGAAPGSYTIAGNFALLENKDGTGSIDDLFRDGYRLPSGPSQLPASEAFDVQSQDSGVTIVDAFYLDGATPNNAPALVKMCKDIYLQF